MEQVDRTKRTAVTMPLSLKRTGDPNETSLTSSLMLSHAMFGMRLQKWRRIPHHLRTKMISECLLLPWKLRFNQKSALLDFT
jgi:hypothetical protein